MYAFHRPESLNFYRKKGIEQLSHRLEALKHYIPESPSPAQELGNLIILYNIVVKFFMDFFPYSYIKTQDPNQDADRWVSPIIT